MARKKKPVLRLTIFFISVVLVSGSILAYLSINNISNLKELTEKRIQEEQKNLALTLSDHFEEEITDLAEKFSDYWDRHNIGQADGMMLMDTFVLIEQVFLLGDYGNFIWPWFIDGFENRNIRKSPARFHTNFDQGERAEFIEKDFSKANSKYLSALRASTNNLDSVQSLNALARLSVKKEDGKQAFIYYSSIISKFPGICDSHGFPYVYYAMPQLIRISNTKNRDQILQEMQSCLVGMEDGKIPLNQSSLDILKQVNDWIDVKSNSNTLINKHKESIQKIRYRLSFIDRNKEVIREYLRTDNKNIFPLINIEYHALNGKNPNGGELVLINDNDEYARGFSILMESLWAKLSPGSLASGTEFEYELELGQIGNRTNASESPHATFFEISTYFPGYYVLIKLQEESLIDELVKRRSWIYGIALTLLLGGMILGILLILRDISREEHLAQLRAEFISNVTHELKTPLTSIQLFTESIALNRIKSAVQKNEYLQIILKETESLKRMINNILDFSKGEKGKLNYHFKDVNVTALVNEAIQDLEYWLVEKKFTLVKEIDDGVTATVDPGAIKQVIINLLNNAIKFSRSRKEILVSLKKEGEMIFIQVKDKGIGIPENQKDLIFQPFYRVEQKSAEEISGTGLGLSVVKDIVKAHHGNIKVESQLKEGSSFTILFKSTQENSG
jgi:signal transduction histidine kinase